MKNFIVILSILLLISCKSSTDKSSSGGNTPAQFFNIDYETALRNKQEMLLGDFASDVQYVKLETNDSCLIRPVVKYFFTEDFIFVKNRDHILKFSREGKFLQKIGNPGRGPGEIDLIRIMSVIPEKKLIIIQLNSQKKMLHFSFDGELLKTVDFKPQISNINVCPDGKLLTYERGARGYEKYTFCLATETWDTLSLVRNYQNWKNTSNTVISIAYNTFDPFYLSEGKTYFKDMYNDTVYCTDADRIKPSYFLNMGKFRLPPDLRPERLGPNQIQLFHDNSGDYYFGRVHEAAGKIFFATHCYQESNPSKYILFDRRKQEGIFLSGGDGPSKGFINDWDGGFDFWPIGSVNENQVFMPVSVMAFQKELENKAGDEKVRDPEKQKQLAEMISGMDVSDNPVLVVVTIR